jgi:hypothetical protein
MIIKNSSPGGRVLEFKKILIEEEINPHYNRQ